MQNRSSKTKREPKDINELAFDIVESLTSENKPADEDVEKDMVAVERGRRGGKVGGTARAAMSRIV